MSKSSKKGKNSKAAGKPPVEDKVQEKKISVEIINESDDPVSEPIPAEAPEKKPEPAKAEAPEKKPEPAKAEAPEKKPEPAKAEVPEKKPEPAKAEVPEKKPEPAKAEVPEKKPEPAKAEVPEKKPLPVAAPVGTKMAEENNPADKKVQKDAEKRAKEQQKVLTKQQKENEKARKKAAKEAEKQNPDAPKEKVSKKRYGEVMTTGQFLGTLILMLIPGINIICVIIWALGGSKNRNRVNFTRGAILFFLIEILLSAAILGGGIVYAQSQQAKVIKYLDNQTGGLLTYMNVDSYQELSKICDVHKYLVEKDAGPVEVPETRVIENPEGINSFEDFMALYNVYTGKETAPETTQDADSTDNADTENADNNQTEAAKQKTLKDILVENNIDTAKSGLVYIILDNGNNDCVICFDPSGKIQNVPTIQMNADVIYVGGAK